MGAYLSTPKTDKASTDEINNYLAVGASSMQGWRNSQEDAHNAILNFDTDTSFFAVYDGHGGAEVAQYCADKLPEFLKNLETYKGSDFEKALVDAFLGFDKTLLEPQVVSILKILAGERNYVDQDDSDAMEDDEDDEDLEGLHEEGHIPLDELLGKYQGHPDMPELIKLKENAVLNSKPQSPYLRGRRAAAIAADAANKAAMDPEAKPQGSSTSAAAIAAIKSVDEPSSSKPKLQTSGQEPEDDSTVSSSSSSASKSNNNSNVSSESTEAEAATAQKVTVNGASSPVAKDGEQNGNVTSSVSKATVAADVSTSSNNVKLVEEKPSVSADDTVSGSNEATHAKQQNGSVASSSVATTATVAEKPDISSTSKDAEKSILGIVDNADDEDDADYDGEKTLSDSQKTESDECSSDEEMDGVDGDDDDDDDDDGDDEDDDDDDGEDGEDEYDEEGVANDQFCANMIEEPGKDSGCTAVVSLLRGRDLYVANAGDSRCVISRNGKAIEMSLDHKPEDDEESSRIIKAGGRVTLDGRVNGGLNLSRAIGDHAYKMNLELPAEEQMISALPDIKKLIITPEDEFMVLACDGIWNYMSSEEVVDFVRVRLQDESKKLSQICEELFDNCLAPNTMGDGTGCDNMTAVIVKFKPDILKLSTKLNPKETEDVLLAKKQKEAAPKAAKRCASPASPIDETVNELDNANNAKRQKTEEVTINNEANACGDGPANSTSTNDKNTSAASSSSSLANSAEQKECDSIINSNIEEMADAAVVSST